MYEKLIRKRVREAHLADRNPALKREYLKRLKMACSWAEDAGITPEEIDAIVMDEVSKVQ